MAYSELIKNYEKIRSYMRDFYIRGFKSRDEFSQKSARSYDDERRRIESWLSDYMSFRNSKDGKVVFISIDSRLSRHNPLYKAWKAKSFTDGDISLHFMLMSILSSGRAYTISQLSDEMDRIGSFFEERKVYDESTVRKKLNEYEKLGLVKKGKDGKSITYALSDVTEDVSPDALEFFSEVAPCGVVGSFLLDKAREHEDYFMFKHHYISQSLDSRILSQLLDAMHAGTAVELDILAQKSGRNIKARGLPLKIYISVETGRQYVLLYSSYKNRLYTHRIDGILKVSPSDEQVDPAKARSAYRKLKKNIWGVSTGRGFGGLEHVEFTVYYTEDEKYILNRLQREKRNGTVTILDETSARFSIDVLDSQELIPWMRSFFCRLSDVCFSNREVEDKFFGDFDAMRSMYLDTEEDGADDVQ